MTQGNTASDNDMGSVHEDEDSKMNKDQISRAACILFSQKGLKAVSVEDICRAIGIAKKTFYIYYISKDNLIEEFIETSFLTLFQTLQEVDFSLKASKRIKIVDEHLVDFMIRFNPVVISDLRRHHRVAYQNLMQSRQKLIQHLATIIEYGKQQGEFRENADALILAELRLNELEAIYLKLYQMRFSDLYQYQIQLFEHFLAGLYKKETQELGSQY